MSIRLLLEYWMLCLRSVKTDTQRFQHSVGFAKHHSLIVLIFTEILPRIFLNLLELQHGFFRVPEIVRYKCGRGLHVAMVRRNQITAVFFDLLFYFAEYFALLCATIHSNLVAQAQNVFSNTESHNYAVLS